MVMCYTLSDGGSHFKFPIHITKNVLCNNHSCISLKIPNVKKASKPITLQDTFNDLLFNIQKPLGIHHIRTILFSLPVNYLKDIRDFGLDKGGVDPFSLKYRLSSITCDVAFFRLFKPVRSEPLHDNNRKFLHIQFANKGIDAILKHQQHS
jgi:hypothetical protein